MKVLSTTCVVLIAAGCATEVPRAPAALTAVAPGAGRPQIEMAQDTDLQSYSTYHRVLAAGTRWQLVGRIPQGDVYRRADGVFTIEGAQVHEAFLVVAGERLVGFYLPVEKAYSEATPVQLKLK